MMGDDYSSSEEEKSRKRRVEESALNGFLGRSSDQSGTHGSDSSSSDIYHQPAFDEDAERRFQDRASGDIASALKPAGADEAPPSKPRKASPSYGLSIGAPRVSDDSSGVREELAKEPTVRSTPAPAGPGQTPSQSPLERAMSWLKDRFSGSSASASQTPAMNDRNARMSDSPAMNDRNSRPAPADETQMAPLMMNLREGSPNPHVVAGRSTGYVKDYEAPSALPGAKGFKSSNLRLAYGGLSPEGDEPQAQPSPGVGDGPSSKTDVPEETARQKVVDPQQSTPAAIPQGQSPQGTAPPGAATPPGMGFLDRMRNLSPETKSQMIRLLGRASAPVGSMNPFIAEQFPHIAQGAAAAQKAQEAETEENAKLPLEQQARQDAMRKEAQGLQMHREQLASTEKWRQAMEDYRRLQEAEGERRDKAREQQAKDVLDATNAREAEKEKATADRAGAAQEHQDKKDAATREFEAREHAANRANARWIAEHGTKGQGLDDKEVQALSKDLNENARSNPVVAKNQERINAAGRVKALAQEANGDPRNLTPQQMQELAVSVNSLISGSSGGAAHEIDALVPKSGAGRVADIQQYILNQPRGANQQAFVKQMLETADREEQVASQQIKDAHAKVLPAHRRLLEKDPDSFNSIVQAHGFTPEEADAAVHGKALPKKATVVETRMAPDGRLIEKMSDGTKRFKAAPNAS